MKFERFCVTNYRNIKDSGWIEVNDVTSFIGQNEAGKSNLFEALYRVNPFEAEATYNMDEDWPMDDWGNKGSDDEVCRAQFTLDQEEIASLFDYATSKSDEADNDNEGEEEAKKSKLKLPKSLILEGLGSYGYAPYFSIIDKKGADLDNDLVDEWAKDNVPKFVYIYDYDMSGAQIELNHLKERREQVGWEGLSNEEQTILIILDLAKIDLDDFIEKGQSAEGRTVRSFDKRQASVFLSKQFQNLWSQKKVKFDLDIDATTLNIFVEDEAVGFPVRLNKRSTGFRWYVSFAWKFTHASNGDYENCILLLEEPGVHLHYDGQKDLLKVFEDLAQSNTVLYTTHLASMVNLEYPERIRIVEGDQNNHAAVKHGVVSSKKSPMAVIEQSLGLSADMSGLLGNRQSLIIEGGDDFLILQKLSGLLKADGKEGLSDQIYLWTAKGASQTPMYAAFAIGNHWDAGVLLDSDQAGLTAKEKIKDLYLSEQANENGTEFRTFMLREAADISKTDVAIEDLFPDEFYIDCVNKAYGLAITPEDLPKDGSSMITKKVEAVLNNKHSRQLDKRLVMNKVLKCFDEWHSAKDLPGDTAKHSEKLFKTVNSAFVKETNAEKAKAA